MNFPEIGPAHAPEIEISKKYWMSFPEIGLCHTPENWNFGKISGWVFQDMPIRVKFTIVIFEVESGRNCQFHQSRYFIVFVGLEANGIWFELFLSALTLWRSCSNITALAAFWHCILKKQFEKFYEYFTKYKNFNHTFQKTRHALRVLYKWKVQFSTHVYSQFENVIKFFRTTWISHNLEPSCFCFLPKF